MNVKKHVGRSSRPWSLGKCKWKPQETPRTRMAGIKKGKKPNVGADVEKCLSDCWECKATQPLWKTVRQILQKLNVYLPYILAIQRLGTYPREMKIYLHTKTWTWMFLAALLTVLRRWKWLKCPSADEWRNTLRSPYYGLSLSRKKEGCTSKPYAQCKKPDPKGHILHESICMKRPGQADG